VVVTRLRRPAPQTAAVLLALSREPARWRYGYELCQELGIKAGSMYPILIRLADQGLLETSWEPAGAEPGRPPRHLYQLTAAGRRFALSVADSPAVPLRLRAAQ
jgi:PadR family transcriptional regulator, regulatory protein PadR